MAKSDLKTRERFTNSLEKDLYNKVKEYSQATKIPLSKILDLAVAQYLGLGLNSLAEEKVAIVEKKLTAAEEMEFLYKILFKLAVLYQNDSEVKEALDQLNMFGGTVVDAYNTITRYSNVKKCIEDKLGE